MTITPEHNRALSYHPLTPGRGELHERLREAAKAYAAVGDAILPPSREASLWFTALQESLMWGNAALAIHDPNQPPPTEPPTEPPPEPPAGTIVGPDFGDLSAGTRLRSETFHASLGQTPTHGTHGMGNLEVYSQTVMAQHTRGGGASIVEDRAAAWMDIPHTDDLSVSFDVEFPDYGGQPFDFGWQSKFGWGVGGYHSGQTWPGGSVCYPPDWLIRPVWNHYRRQGRRRFGVYIYSRDQLSHIDGWGTECTGGGFRRLALFDNAPTPEPRGNYLISIGVRKVTGSGPSHLLTASVNGAEFETPVDLGSPATWLTLQDGYGGSAPQEGPNYPTRYMLSGLQFRDLDRA